MRMSLRGNVLAEQAVAQVARQISRIGYSEEHKRDVATLVRTWGVRISDQRVRMARRALMSLPDEMAQSAGVEGDWHSLPLDEMLQAWGWSAKVDDRGGVSISGQSRRVVFADNFAALAVLADYYDWSREFIFCPGTKADRNSKNLFSVEIGGRAVFKVKPAQPERDLWGW